MYNKIISKFIGIKSQDLFRGTSIGSTLKFLTESQDWDEQKMVDYQLFKLRVLLNHASHNVPYYEELFNKIKLKPSDIRSLDDLHKIPVLTKEIARKENIRLMTRDHLAMKNIKKGKTGGTTGAPLVVLKDVQDRSYTWASYYRWFNWMDINFYDRKATLWGAPTVLSKSLKKQFFSQLTQHLQNHLIIDTFQLTASNYAETVKKISDFKPVILKGYLSSLLDLAVYLNDNNLNIIKPKVLSSTTETLLPHNRLFLEKTFQAPIFDQYGCGEISGIAYECAAHDGLHITSEHAIVEVLDNNHNPTVKSGNLVVTNLDNFVMPFIRYENGDRGSLNKSTCSCGKQHPRLNALEGRTTDTITLKNGTKVHGVFFTDILYELNIFTDSVQRFQVYQKEKGKIEFRLETNDPLIAELKEKLNNALLPFFKEVVIVVNKKLAPNQNGKFNYIINDIDSHD